MRRTAVLVLAVVVSACGSSSTTSPVPGAADSAETSTTEVPAAVEPDTSPSSEVTDPAASAPEPAPATTAPAPETTVPATTAAPAPTTPPTPAPTPAPTAAPPPAPDPLTDPSKSMWIEGTEEGDPEAASDGVNCLGFYEAMAAGALSYAACGPWESSNGTYVWAVVKGASNQFFAVVWEETAPFNWVPKMRLIEPAVGIWDSVTLLAADIDSGPNEELISGVRFSGTGNILTLDVIDIRGGAPVAVATLPDLDSAIAFPSASTGVFFHTPQRLASEPLCCPTLWDQFLLASGPGGWTVSEGWAGLPIETITEPDAF